jgi:thiol-disulfide isomerase/thioredoxin
MNQGSAATSIAWEMFSEIAFNGCDVALKAEIEDPQTIDGQECEAIWFVPPKTKTAGGTVNESAIVPSKIYFAKRDGLPRRFEIYRPATATLPADKRGEPTRSLTLNKLVAKADLSGKSFTFDIPAGYTVTDADGRRKSLKPKTDTKPQTNEPESAPASPTASAPATYKWPLLPSADDAMRVGTQAPAFDLKDFDGKPVKLGDFKGKVLVLDFWGTWCPPCRASMPAVQKVYEKYKDRGVVVLGMNSESNPAANPKKFKLDNKITYPSVTKAETVSGLFKVQSWPTFYVFGKDGKLVWASNGLRQPPGGGGGTEAMLEYLESNLSQAIDKAMQAK